MKYTFIVFIMLVNSLAGWAQLRQLPIQYPIPAATSNPSGLLDTTWWVPGSQVQILPRPGNGI